MQQWLPVFQALIAARSVWGEEHEAVAIVERALTGLAVAFTEVPFDAEALAAMPGAQPPFSQVPGRRNLIATIPGSGGGRSLIVNCHLDVVPEGNPADWRHPPFAGAIEDGQIFGRGSYDDKAGVVICLALLERFASRPLRGDLIAHFVLEDETTGNGSLLCLAHGPVADAAIIVDGTRAERGINEHAGNVRFGVTVFGRPASVSVSHMGVNAAELLSELVLEIRSAVFALNGQNAAPWTQYPSPNQCSVVALNCPEATLTVPPAASATCYATFTPPRTLAEFRQVVSDEVKRFAARHRLERLPEVDWRGFATEPVRAPAAALESAISTAAGQAIPFGPSTGTSDLRHFAARGVPAVLFGPGVGQNPHQANESVSLASVANTTEVLARTIDAWCG